MDRQHMISAITLASKGLGETSPNPCVGCVIVDKHGTVVGQGYHHKAGQPHAEVLALKEAGDKAKGSTAYVSLEPCNHYGRTPPCTLALINHGIARVVVGMVDPDPRVSGAGVTYLKDQGISVDVGVERERCESLNRPFIHRVLKKKPLSVVWACFRSSSSSSSSLETISDAIDCLSSSTRRIDIVASRLASISPEVDSIVVHVDDFVGLPASVIDGLPAHVSIIILGMGCSSDACNKAVGRIYAEDDVKTRKWYLFVDEDNDITSARDNVMFMATASTRVSGSYFTRLISGDMLQKIASLGSNAILLVANSLEELKELKSNDALQKLVLSSTESLTDPERDSLWHNMAKSVVRSLVDSIDDTNESLAAEKTTDTPFGYIYNFWGHR